MHCALDNKVISAYTETFLLEKSRLVTLFANECNYHGTGHHNFLELESALRTIGCRGDEL